VILLGHPTGNPNSHHAALAHYERGRLAAFCVPWFPSASELTVLSSVPGCRTEVARLRRRRFEPLADAPKVQGRLGEWGRMVVRLVGRGDQRLSYQANDWLMRTMVRECRREGVTAVHSFEDCSLLQFEEAKRRGIACVYDMPIGYFPYWQDKQNALVRKYADWIPSGGIPSSRYVRPEQKIKEMAMADLVLVACSFVEKTIREFHPEKKIALAPYGVDVEFWSPFGKDEEARRRKDEKTKRPKDKETKSDKIRFIYAGQSSIRKGIPSLMEAWEKARLHDAELLLVGSWQLPESKLKQLPSGVRFLGPVGPEKLRDLYREADVFVFPSYFEGYGLVILEAMACGLPVIASDCSAGPDVLDETCGRVVAPGDVEQLAETFRWFGANREQLPSMRKAARAKAEVSGWERYRVAVSEAVGPFVG